MPSKLILNQCSGEFGCACLHLRFPLRIKGGTPLSQYKKGIRTPETRAANAEYIRKYRERKSNGVSTG